MRGAPRTAACHDEPRRATTSQPFANRPKRLGISWPIHLADSHIVRHYFREAGVAIREVLLSRLTIAPAVMTHQSRSANHSVSQLAIVIAFCLAIGGQPATPAILPIFNTGVDSSGVALQPQEAWICTGGTRGMTPSPPSIPTEPGSPPLPAALPNPAGSRRIRPPSPAGLISTARSSGSQPVPPILPCLGAWRQTMEPVPTSMVWKSPAPNRR